MKQPSWFQLIGILFLSLTLSSCSLLQNKLPDTTPTAYPSTYSLYGDAPDYNTKWWEGFNSVELNQLIESAITNNFDVQQAWARLEQSKAQAAKSGSYQYPEASVYGGYTRSEQQKDGQDQVSTDTYNLGASISYEIDLWGKISSNKKSSNLELKATREDVSAAIMSLSGSIAETWINLISLYQQEQSILDQLQLNRQLMGLIQNRLVQAKSTPLDLYQQQQTIASLEAALIPIRSKRELYQHQLSLLLGKPATNITSVEQTQFPKITDVPNTGLPTDLLSMRPDIRAAGLRLKAANWEISAAKADRLPSFKLTASYTYSSDEISTIFDNWLMNLAANLTGPIFDAGRRKNEVKRVEAVVNEKLAGYQKTVLTAVKEVEDALVEEKYYREELASKTFQLALSQKTMNEAKRRYLYGSNDFLSVLREQLNIATYENNLVQAHANILIARVQLQKALGGTWLEQLTPVSQTQNKSDQ